MKTKTSRYLLGIAVLFAQPLYASNVYLSLDTYDYVTNLGDIDLDYKPLGLTVGGSLDLSDSVYLKYQYGSWSDEGSAVSMSDSANSDFDSTLLNIGIAYRVDAWTASASYTDLKDEMSLNHGRNLEFLTTGDTNSSSLKVDLSFTSEAGSWSRFAKLGLQYDEATTMAFLDQENEMLRQKSDATYGTLEVGTDYFQASSDNAGWFLGANVTWYQELSSDESIDQMDMSELDRRGGAPNAGRGNAGQGGTAGVSVNRTFGESFGILSLYATYMLDENWSLDLAPSFGFGGDVNANSLSLMLAYNY
jgi:hypothetical protein